MRSLLPISLGLVVGVASTALIAQTAPPVYFSHATIFLSPDAYTSMLQSAFLRDEFSWSEERTTQMDAGRGSVTGIYLFGQHTYLEIYKAGREPYTPSIPGQLWFNMWVDDRGRLPRFRDLLSAENGAPMQINTIRNAQNAPSYDAVMPEGGMPRLVIPDLIAKTMIKGYYPDGITREKRQENNYLPDRLLHEVTGITLTVNEAERDHLIHDFRAYSYSIRADGEKQIVSSPEITFTLVPVKPKAPRTLVIDLSLNLAQAGEQTYNFGDGGELRIQGRAARWAFSFPGN